MFSTNVGLTYRSEQNKEKNPTQTLQFVAKTPVGDSRKFKVVV